MLTRPLTRKDGDDGGLGLVVVSSHPSLPLDNEADDDDETQTGLFFPPAPAWHSSSSSSSSPSPPPCASSSPPAHSQTASPTFHSPSPLTPPAARSSPDLSFSSLPVSPSPSSACPPTPVAPTLLSAASSTPFPSSTSLFSPLSPFPAPKSLLPPAPHCHGGSSSLFILPPLVLPSSVSSSTPVSTIPTSSSVSPPISSLCISLSSSSPPVHPPFHLLPPSVSSPYLVCNPTPPTLAVSTSIPRPSPHDTPPPAFYTPCPPPSSSSPPVPSTLFSPPSPSFSQFPTAPSVLPPAPPPCCHCSSLLPRLLSAHRLEIRRLLRGAVASLGRRLDSLERRSSRKMRKKRSGHRGGEEGGREVCSRVSAVSSPSPSSSSLNSAHNFPVTSSSSSSDNEDSPTPPLCSGLSESEQRRRRRRRSTEEGEEEDRGKKRRRKIHRREMSIPLENTDEDTEEEDTGRFVGRMAVSFRGGSEEEALLTLYNFDHRKHRGEEERGTSQSEKAVTVIRRNGFRAPPLLHRSSNLSSQNPPHLLQAAHSGPTCNQSEALDLSSGRFFDLPPLNPSSNQSAFHFWMWSSSSSSIRPSLILRLSAVAVETVSETMRGGAYGSHLWTLKDWTAPPSLSSDHCYMQASIPSPPSPARRQLKKRTNHSSRSLHLPRRRALPSCSANGLSAVLPTSQSPADSEFLKTNGERGKRVSQIRIRRAPPRETSLTPMGLPKVKRLKKKEFSLEEIYTNKNYKSPNTNRSLETIFEEPRGKDGELLRIGHQRRRRLLLFPDFTQPRKRKRPQGAGLPVTTVPRKRAAARRNHGSSTTNDESDLDVMLVERLSALEDFLMRQGLDV